QPLSLADRRSSAARTGGAVRRGRSDARGRRSMGIADRRVPRPDLARDGRVRGPGRGGPPGGGAGRAGAGPRVGPEPGPRRDRGTGPRSVGAAVAARLGTDTSLRWSTWIRSSRRDPTGRPSPTGNGSI